MCKRKNGKNHAKEADGDLEQSLDSFVRKTERAQNKRYYKAREALKKLENEIALVGLGILAVYTWFTIALWCAEQTANQINSASYVAANRPWIKVSVNPSDLSWLPSGILGDTGSFYPSVIVKNMGKSPALEVNYVEAAYLDGFPGETLDAAQTNACKLLPGMLKNTGKILFPGDQIDLTRQQIGINGTGVNQAEIERIPGFTASKTFNFILFGCVDYLFGTTHYQTFFAYQLWNIEKDADGPYISSFSIGKNVPAANILMVPTWQNNYPN